MGKGGMIIRLIDIGLTVLFGFICVADIEQKTQVKIPSQAYGVPNPTKVNTITIVIYDGPRYVLTEENQILMSHDDLEEVEKVLIDIRRQFVEKNQDVIFLVQPDPNSPIQLTVNILDVCERNQFQKSINYVQPGV